MALKMSKLLKKNKISVVVNFPGDLSNMKNSETSGYILKKNNNNDFNCLEYFKTLDVSLAKIKKVLKLVQLDEKILEEKVEFLTTVEWQKMQLCYLLLLKTQIIIIDRFFESLIYSEQQYFWRLLRNLVEKQDKSIIVLEDDMNFVSEITKDFILFTEGENFRFVDNFYDDSLYKYVKMPWTVELVKYLEKCGHQIDHEITFSETLKAVYRGGK